MRVLAADLKQGDIVLRYEHVLKVESVRQLVTRVAGMTIKAVEIEYSSVVDPHAPHHKILLPETNEVELVNEDA